MWGTAAEGDVYPKNCYLSSAQHEYRFVADNFDEAVRFLVLLGAKEKSRQEKRRETWLLDDGEIVIDEWPFLEPYVEVEGPSENSVRALVTRLGFDYAISDFYSTGIFIRPFLNPRKRLLMIF